MKVLRVFKNSCAIIAEKKESDFAYLLSHSFGELELLTKVKKYRGAGVRFLVFIYNVLSRVRIVRSDPNGADAKYFFFAGSQNQLNSLHSTYSAVTENKKALLVLDGECTKSNEGRYPKLSLSPLLLFVVLALTLARLPRLLIRSIGKESARPFRFYLDVFLACYFYVPYFFELLERSRVETVFVSNDHTPANRSLMAVCQHLGIKTVYMQHASVSTLFPPLEFDYVFLDGGTALDIYREIAQRAPSSHDKFKECSVFLNGQKKPVPLNFSINADEPTCGIGFSHLDSEDFILDVTQRLADVFAHTVVRLHPSHRKESASSIERGIASLDGRVTLSKGRQEPVAQFIASIDVFFGTESSLHLEVASAGCRCFRIVCQGEETSDYYGYLEKGLCTRVDIKALDASILNTLEQTELEQEAVRGFNASYGTVWFGREGELTVKTVEALNEEHRFNERLLTDLGYKHSQIDSNVWALTP